jgi:predicted phosphodiesterase
VAADAVAQADPRRGRGGFRGTAGRRGVRHGVALLAAALACVPAAAQQGPVADTTGREDTALRVFLVSDTHSRTVRVARLLEEVRSRAPDLVLDAGDMVHDGTETEFRHALAARAATGVPWYVAPGNHDHERRGPHAAPPVFADFAAVDHGELRLILLDNHDETLSEAQFERLEAELAAHAGRRILVVMHVPALLTREPLAARLRHLLPFPLASPAMRVPAQVERFTTLMARHEVLAVLTGHTHTSDALVRDGVHYIATGAVGGLRPGLGIPNQYTEILIEGRRLSTRRVALAPPPLEPIGLLVEAFGFYAALNAMNHAAQGWNYVPSASVQLSGALRRTRVHGAAGGAGAAAEAAAAFERLLGHAGRRSLFAELALSAGDAELAGHLGAGYRARPVGDYNRGAALSGALFAGGGLMAGRATSGLGARLGLALEWRHLTLELSHTRATDHRAARLALGHRF